MKASNNGGGASNLRSPQVRCDRQHMAFKVRHQQLGEIWGVEEVYGPVLCMVTMLMWQL